MTRRCPLCYEEIEPRLWNDTWGSIWCAEVRTQDAQGPRLQRVHVPERPSRMNNPQWAEVSAERINVDYREIAHRHPELVRPVCVSGYSQQGKTCFLLSLSGTLFYPNGNDQFSQMFPTDLEFQVRRGSLAPLDRSGSLNLVRSLEEMWIDGALPLPNPIERALSSPLIFSTTGGRRLVTLINDVAGEAMGPDLAGHPAFPHVIHSRDIIYVLRASEFRNSFLHFEQFVAGLRQGLPDKGQTKNGQFDPRHLNLILALSQLDRLHHGAAADARLLELCLERPYLLPQNRDRQELRAYLGSMVRVHDGLRKHLLETVPNLVKCAEKAFGSVRYTGFSSFGHHPLPRDLAPHPDCNGWLTAAPRPVRVVDPLLWILWDQGIINA
jgi:hypothetical protein